LLVAEALVEAKLLEEGFPEEGLLE
jgi:hypothetical protein